MVYTHKCDARMVVAGSWDDMRHVVSDPEFVAGYYARPEQPLLEDEWRRLCAESQLGHEKFGFRINLPIDRVCSLRADIVLGFSKQGYDIDQYPLVLNDLVSQVLWMNDYTHPQYMTVGVKLFANAERHNAFYESFHDLHVDFPNFRMIYSGVGEKNTLWVPVDSVTGVVRKPTSDYDTFEPVLESDSVPRLELPLKAVAVMRGGVFDHSELSEDLKNFCVEKSDVCFHQAQLLDEGSMEPRSHVEISSYSTTFEQTLGLLEGLRSC